MKNITVKATVNKNIEQVWDMWTDPRCVEKWNFASDDWECPYAENDLTVGGRFFYKMAAKDGSTGFDFTGKYSKIVNHSLISYVLDDGREVSIVFKRVSDTSTEVVETFEMENENSEELQRSGWQAILDNFKKYADSSNAL